jgi:hypothetical protein
VNYKALTQLFVQDEDEDEALELQSLNNDECISSGGSFPMLSILGTSASRGTKKVADTTPKSRL